MDNFLHHLQWPAMIITLVAAWLIASTSRRNRKYGFGCFIVSNVLWIVWGWNAQAFAQIPLQLGLFALNIRGAKKME